MAGSLLAFGLYSVRQRARSAGIFVRVVVAISAGVAVTAVCFYIMPDRQIGGRVVALAAMIAAVIVVILRLGFSRFVDDTPFKREGQPGRAQVRTDREPVRARPHDRGIEIQCRPSRVRLDAAVPRGGPPLAPQSPCPHEPRARPRRCRSRYAAEILTKDREGTSRLCRRFWCSCAT
jgi:hypothetical protein